MDYDVYKIPSPCYVVDERLLVKNLEVLKYLKQSTGCKVLLAQKAFSMYSMYKTIAKYIDGTTASGLFEARLGYEEMGKENHIFSPAYIESEFDEITKICKHIVFNSFEQFSKYKHKAIEAGCECGIRINPEFSTQDEQHEIYDPCGKYSRLGVTKANFRDDMLDGISGIHFHTLCEQNSDDFASTLEAVENKFGEYLKKVKWLNIGGGHHITRADYDIELLIKSINNIKNKYDLDVYVEPGEAVVLNAGFLVSTVLEKVHNGIDIAILDASAACHMPDVLEVPYRPNIIGAGMPNEKKYTVRLGGNTCLAGDIIGDYSFDSPINVGDRLVFCDMAHYTMVKNNTFNGMALPEIGVIGLEGHYKTIKKFGYDDFKSRL